MAEVCRQKLAIDPIFVPILKVLLFRSLVRQLFGDALHGVFEKAVELLRALPLACGGVLERIIAVQQRRVVLTGNAAVKRAILRNGHTGEIHRRPLFVDQQCRRGVLPHKQGEQPLQKLLPLRRIQIAHGRVGGAAGGKGHLSCKQRREAEHGIEQVFVAGDLISSLGHVLEGVKPLAGVDLFGALGQPIAHAGDELPALALRHVDVAQRGQNRLPDPKQNQIAHAAHHLQHQLPLLKIAQFADHLKMQTNHAFERFLNHVEQTRAHQMFSKQHAQHGRNLWIFSLRPCELYAGAVLTCTEQQANISLPRAQQKHRLVFLGHVDLVDTRPREAGLKFPCQMGQCDGV